MTPLLAQPLRELSRRRRLASALETNEQHDARPLAGRGKPALGVAEEAHHFVANDLDDLLRRRQAVKNVLPHRAVAYSVDERLDDLEIDVGLEQRQTDLAQRGLNIFRRQPRFAAERFKYA